MRRVYIFLLHILLIGQALTNISHAENSIEKMNNLLSKSIEMIDSKRYSDAEKSINLILDQYPDFKPAIYYRALARINLNKIDEGKNDLLVLVHLGESFPDLFFYLGLVSEMQDENIDAIDYYSKAISLDSTNSRYYNNRGVAYAKEGEFELGFNDVNKAISINSQYARAYFNRALYLYYIKKDTKLAIDDMRRSKKLYALKNRIEESNSAQDMLAKWID